MNFKALLGTELPIIQAPMAGVQNSALALAVAKAGGLGSLPCAMLGAEAITAELTTIRAESSAPINVNFFCHTPPIPDPAREAKWRATLAPYYEEFGIDPKTIPDGPGRTPFSHAIADCIESFKPEVISFHFGLPAEDLLQRVKGWGSKIISSATTVAEAEWLEAHGADGIIAQGLEAGGHRGMFLSDDITTQVGTFALVPQIVDRVNIPVIAAGGIADRKGVAAVLSLGAVAAQVGTAYLLCDETKTNALHRAAIKSPRALHTALTNTISGRPARGIINRLIREIGPMSDHAPEFPLAASALAPLKAAVEATDADDFSSLWCGQNARGCQNISATALTEALGQFSLIYYTVSHK